MIHLKKECKLTNLLNNVEIDIVKCIAHIEIKLKEEVQKNKN
jgi:hypothetical protein